jgi:hypothetical protein
MEKTGNEAVFITFSLHRLIDEHGHLTSRAGVIYDLVADVPSGLNLFESQKLQKILENLIYSCCFLNLDMFLFEIQIL